MDVRPGRLATLVLAGVINFSTLWAALPAQAEVYKWVDASGRVHFGDQAPANQKAQSLDFPETDAAPAASEPSELERRQRQDKLARALEEDRLEKERQQTELKQQAEKKKAYCERFKNRMERLEASSQVYSENKDGTIQYWKDKDADRYKAQQRAKFQEECGAAD